MLSNSRQGAAQCCSTITACLEYKWVSSCSKNEIHRVATGKVYQSLRLFPSISLSDQIHLNLTVSNSKDWTR